MQKKEHTDLAKGKGNHHSCNVNHEILEIIFLPFDFYDVKGLKVRRYVVLNNCLVMGKIVGSNKLLILFSIIVHSRRLRNAILVPIIDMKNP